MGIKFYKGMASNEYEFVQDEIEAELLPNLARFIRIPNQSREFDGQWETNGLLKKAAVFVVNWASQQGLERFKVEILEEAGRTPTIIGVVEPQPAGPGMGQGSDLGPAKNILIYGHVDKQPPLTEQWHSGKTPYVPVYEGGRMYGRGSGDDGYAWFAAVILIKALQKYKLQRHRYVLVFESDEESDSKDLLYFLKKREALVGTPDVVLCLDSGTVDEQRLSMTASMRGVFDVDLNVQLAHHAVHSGDAGGILPDSFRVLRHLLKSIESSTDGKITIEEFNRNIPEKYYRDAEELVKMLGPDYKYPFPFLPGVKPSANNLLDLYLNSTWRPQMTMIGIDGVPSTSNAGNVVRPSTLVRLSFRLPPDLSVDTAIEALEKRVKSVGALYNAKVTMTVKSKGNGFMADPPSQDMAKRLDEASQHFFGKPVQYFFESGSIPFMNDLKAMFPKADFLLTGILGPGSGAHGPNEYADIVYLRKFLCALVFTFR